MENLVFGSAERRGNPIDAAEIPVVRDNDAAIGQGARPTEKPDQYSALTASAGQFRHGLATGVHIISFHRDLHWLLYPELMRFRLFVLTYRCLTLL